MVSVQALGGWRRVGMVGTVAALLASLAVTGLLGCRRSTRTAERGPRHAPEHEAAMQSDLFQIAIATLGRVEQFESDETFSQVIDRLNQWLQSQKPPSDWAMDPLAAPLLKALAALAEQVAPIHKELAPTREQVELKSRARQLVELPPKLEALAQRIDPKRLDELSKQQEEVIQQIESSVRQWGDPDRLAEVEAKYQEIFSSEVRDKTKLALLEELLVFARALDWPSRLRDPMRLGALAQQLESLCRERGTSQVKAVAQQFEETIARRLGPAGKTKLVIQVNFLARQLDDIPAMKDLAAMRVLKRHLGDLAQQLRSAGQRSGRDDVRKLSAQLDAAIERLDFQELSNLARQLEALARPDSFEDLGDFGPRLDQAAQRLSEAGRRMDEAAKALQLGNLAELAEYCRQLGTGFGELNTRLKPAAAPAKPAPAAQPLDAKTAIAVFLELAMRLEMLVQQMSYFSGMESLAFPAIDIANLQEAVLVRDLSRWARGEDADDVSRAKRLFDWTIRNIQLEAERIERDGKVAIHVMQTPWETLFYGRGTATERAWVFLLLARQQGLDAAVLALAPGSDAQQSPGRAWAVGVLSEGSVYVFDPGLGLPIPARNGRKLDESGQLDVQPATLAELAADGGLLRQMDAGRDHPYPVKSSDLKKVVALLDASPWWLTPRMRLVESRLAGDDRMVLCISPAAQAERWKAAKAVAEVRLWTVAYETLFQRIRLGSEFANWEGAMMAPFRAAVPSRSPAAPQQSEQQQVPIFAENNPELAAKLTRSRQGASSERSEPAPTAPLRVGRLLHLKGQFLGAPSATSCYQMVRLPDSQLAELGGADNSLVANLRRAKQHATYWLGLLALEQQNYRSARDYLAARTLEATPRSSWFPGAKYNLGRVCEAEKQYAKAILQYRGNTEAIDYLGNWLRAQWLQALAKPADLKELSAPEPGRPKDAASETPDLPGLPGLPDDMVPKKKPEATDKKADAPKTKPKTKAETKIAPASEKKP